MSNPKKDNCIRDVEADVFGDLRNEDTSEIAKVIVKLWETHQSDLARRLEQHISTLIYRIEKNKS